MWPDAAVRSWVAHVQAHSITTTSSSTTTTTNTASRPALLLPTPPPEERFDLEVGGVARVGAGAGRKRKACKEDDYVQDQDIDIWALGYKRFRMDHTAEVPDQQRNTRVDETDIDLDIGATPRARRPRHDQSHDHGRDATHQQLESQPHLPFYNQQDQDPTAEPPDPPSFPLRTVPSDAMLGSDVSSSLGSKRSRDDPPSSPSKSSKRRTSPAKKRLDRPFAPYPVRRQFLDNIDRLPERIRFLAQNIVEVSDGEDILPDDHPLATTSQLFTGVPKKDARIFAHNQAKLQRDALGTAPAIDAVQIILRDAARLNDACSEAEWNGLVHVPLLRLAIAGSKYRERVMARIITSANIMPEYLSNRTVDDKGDSRRVDLCIALELSGLEAIVQGMQRNDIQCLNHTDYGGLRHSPIAISIETKPPDGSQHGGIDQLQTWTQSHFNFLRDVLTKNKRRDVEIPALPVLLAHGHDWFCHYMHDEGSHVTFWQSGAAFGTTANALGTYQIIAGLQYLLHWIDSVYWPWLDREILQPLLEFPAQP